MIKGCLFDLDGTLLDTLVSIRYYLNKTLTKYGIRNISTDEAKIFVGSGARILVQKALIAAGVDISKDDQKRLCEKILKEYVDSYDENPGYLTEPYQGISETIEALNRAGLKLAIISNKPDSTVKLLAELSFKGKFDIIEGASEKMPLKPDAKWPLDICERMGLKPCEVMYLGDTSTDMQTAKNFGAGLAVGVLWGFRSKDELIENGADTVIEQPFEILQIIK